MHLADGTALPAEVVVLATGIAPRLSPSGLPDDPRILDAWDECALASLPREGRVLILGAGLSALDVVALLDAHGFRGAATILSRRGLLPRPHLTTPGAPAPLRAGRRRRRPATTSAPCSAGPAPSCASVERAASRGSTPSTPSGRTSPASSAASRPRTAPASCAPCAPTGTSSGTARPPRRTRSVDALARRTAASRSSRAASPPAPPAPSALQVELDARPTPRAPDRYDASCAASAPRSRAVRGRRAARPALIASGLAAADPAGLGLVTDEHGRVIDPRGPPSDRLFAIGALRRASSWETTAVPDIAAHALALARCIVP